MSGAVLNSLSREELEAENVRLRAALAAAGIDAQQQRVEQAERDGQHRLELAFSQGEAERAQQETRTAHTEAASAAATHRRDLAQSGAALTASQDQVASLGAARLALAHSEARQRAIFESAVDFAIVVTDRDGIVTDWNSGAENVMGWTAAEMRGQSAARFFTPEDQANGRVAYEMRRALETGRATDERWHLRKDGQRFWASGEMMPLLDDARVHLGFVKILRDRTAQRKAGEQQRADAEFMRSVLAASADCIKVLDLDGRLSFMSEGGMRVMEVSDFNLIKGCPWPDFWQGQGHTDALAALEAAKAGGVGHFQGQADTYLGTPKWWDVQVTAIPGADGQPERLLSVSRDLTSQKAAERDLACSEARWRGLFEGMQEGFFLGELIRDAEGHAIDYRFVEINPAFAQQSGLPIDSVGKTIRSFVPDIDQWLIDNYARVVETGKPTLFEITVPELDRTFEVRANKEQDERFSCLFLDVTARRQADIRRAAMAELADRLRDQNDRREISRIAAEIMGRTLGLSHAGYAQVNSEQETVTVAEAWSSPDLPSIAGVHHFRDYGSYIEDLKAGRDVVIADITRDPRTAPDAAALAAINVAAVLNLPVMEHGRFVALLYALHPKPHAWSPEDVAFARNIVDRTRAAIARVEAEEQQAVLNRELSHRLKNTLAIVQAITTQTLRNATDLSTVRDVLGARLIALGKAHDILLTGQGESADMRAVIAGAVELHDDERSRRFTLEGPALRVGESAALSLSLMIHELATNAAKYGALSAPGGRVQIAWTINGGAGEERVQLTWQEQGGPQVTPPTRKGFGSRLIERGFAGAVSGEVVTTYPPEGVICTLKAPLAAFHLDLAPHGQSTSA
ncbi:PAS domain-containing protein [Methylobacterium sp. CCH5-D2]|uniref:PAS domain-containing sensor histidine kinase n=1 Tax=Methylobacterium sp. CCH5-D2 TaxID=1768765 RepID=UPI0008331F4E|nr:PAS domain-containing protein [Methylobacterium sp. CCH5-D2]